MTFDLKRFSVIGLAILFGVLAGALAVCLYLQGISVYEPELENEGRLRESDKRFLAGREN